MESQDVGDLIAQVLNINATIPWNLIGLMIILYFVSIWFVISLWIYNDARKRYESIITSILFSILTFLLGPPMLIFYVIVRPDLRFEDFDDWEAGGVNVPIVNFIGKEGIEMSLELRINPKRISQEKKEADMRLEIGWDNEDEKFKLINREELGSPVVAESKLQQPNICREKCSENVINIFDEEKGMVRRKVRYRYISNIIKGIRTKIGKNRLSDKINIEGDQISKNKDSHSLLDDSHSYQTDTNMNKVFNIGSKYQQFSKKKRKKKKKKRR